MERGVPTKLLKRSVSNMKKCSLKEKLIPFNPDYKEQEKFKPVITESDIPQYSTYQLLGAMNIQNKRIRKPITFELLRRDLTIDAY